MKQKWNITKSNDMYNTSGWGAPYFSIGKNGDMQVHPKGQSRQKISLKTLVDQIDERGIQPPFLLRFNDILIDRLSRIGQSFQTAIKEFEYNGTHSIIYPIKVNQQRHVVDQIARYSAKNGHGLEAGSKPELLAVLSLTMNDKMPVVCNGYKDDEYFEIAMMGRKIGKPVLPVIEKFSEFQTMIDAAKKIGVEPEFGVRIKLSTSGSGKWMSSSGHRSKFGLTITELLRGVALLKKKRLLKGLKLLHFHQGSQITDIGTLKNSLKEAMRVYIELSKLGAPMGIVDVGGGLGVDYNGNGTNHDSSMNYSLQEYANDVVFHIKNLCDQAKIKHPDIFTECGRAVVAHHAVLVFDVLGISSYDKTTIPSTVPSTAPHPLQELFSIHKALQRNPENVIEHYHDIVSNYQECQNLFSLGYFSIQDRGHAEELYFSSLKRIASILERREEELPENLTRLNESLSDTYFGNFSVFQSLPDHWAIQHQFPIMPIHRLKEEPSQSAIIADISCDSDGKIDLFIDSDKGKRVIKLHAHDNSKDYYLGVFLVGAYQETLGDLHNLFGDTNAVHVTLDSKNRPVIETVVKGDTVKEVLSYVQYDVEDLIDNMQTQIEKAVRNNLIDYKESGKFLKFYEESIEGYTYLEDWDTVDEF